MAIEIFTSTSTCEGGYLDALNELFEQAGFTARAESTGRSVIVKTGAIFDHTFVGEQTITFGSPARAGGSAYGDSEYHLVAVVDKDRKLLYVGGQNIMDTSPLSNHMNGCLSLMIFDGGNYMYTGYIQNKTICTYFNLPDGRINQVQKNALSPLWSNSCATVDTSNDFSGVWNSFNTSFYTSLTLKNEALGTIVTDGTNTFTSCGNLIYIKNA